MAERGDISVNQDTDVITVAAPSAELVIQDLHDTMRAYEDDLVSCLHEEVIFSEGKGNLGGGVFVGITSTMQKGRRVAFEGRKGWTATGTVTSTNATRLIDSSATFITDGLEPGAWVVNLTDGSDASVLVVVSETELITDGLGGGTDDTFESGDAYRLKNVTLCEVSGGNLVATDRQGNAINPILPTVGVMVTLTSSSSATLQELLDVQFSSFDGAVLVDPNNDTGLAQSGTDHPAGTGRQPVDNFTDALAIATARGLKELRLIGTSLTLPAGDFSGLRIVGQFTVATSLTVDAAANVAGCEFAHMTLDGTLDGTATVEDCTVGNLSMVEGAIYRSGLAGTVGLSGASIFQLIDCYDAVVGAGRPILDFGGTGMGALVRGYQGALELANKTGPEEVSVDVVSGRLIVAASVTDGTFIGRVHGPKIVNNSGLDMSGIVQVGLPRYVAHGSAAYNADADTLDLAAWLERDDAIVKSPTSMMFVIRDPAGGPVVSLTEVDFTLQASGKYVLEDLSVVLIELTRYDVEISITDVAGTASRSRELVTGRFG